MRAFASGGVTNGPTMALFGEAPPVVIEAIRRVLAGDVYLSADVSSKVLKKMAGAAGGGSAIGGLTSGNDYYAVVVDANTLRLASSRANAVAGIVITKESERP